jgi:hypothetical protein
MTLPGIQSKLHKYGVLKKKFEISGKIKIKENCTIFERDF